MGSIAIYGQNHHLGNLNMGRPLRWVVWGMADLSSANLLDRTGDEAHAMDQPPSIGSVAPVMSCPAGLHRKTAIAPTASMAMKRRVGCRLAR